MLVNISCFALEVRCLDAANTLRKVYCMNLIGSVILTRKKQTCFGKFVPNAIKLFDNYLRALI